MQDLPAICVAGRYPGPKNAFIWSPVLPCPNRILLLISQRHTSLTEIIQPGNNKGLTIPDYLRNFRPEDTVWGMVSLDLVLMEDLNMTLSNFSWRPLNLVFTGNEGFIIPKFQREYNWDETHYGQLWDDIETSIKEKRGSYFFGSLFFMGSEDSKELTIIDGQQRIATITILMAVIRDILYGINNSEHQMIDRDFIQHKEYLSNQTKPKLQLGERNRKEFLDHIQSLGRPDLKIKQFSVVKKNMLDTNKNILNCYEFFFNKIDSNLKAITDKDKENEFLISIIKCVTTVFQTMVISVSDESEAYLVFETLNDRGLELSIADLLKNYLFSKSGSHLKEVQREWDDVIETLNNLDVSTFIRQYWLSTQNQVTEKELFVELKKKLNTKETVLSFVKNLNGESEIYEAILNPNKKYWKSVKIYELLTSSLNLISPCADM